jgi:hypothetical protein
VANNKYVHLLSLTLLADRLYNSAAICYDRQDQL